MAHIEQLPSGSYRFTAYDGGGKKKRLTWKPTQGLTARQLEKEVQKQAALFDNQVKHGQTAESTMKLADFYTFWHDNYAVPNLAPKTVFTYNNLWRRVDAEIGHLRVDKLSPARIQAFYRWLHNHL